MTVPQNVATTTLRAARALIGWMAPNDAMLAMTARQMDAVPTPEQIEWARQARDRVSARPAGVDQIDAVRPLPPELAEYEAQLRVHPAAAAYFSEGWTVQMTDLNRICSFQPVVHADHADERTADINHGNSVSVARVTLPMPLPAALPAQFDQARNAWMFTSTNMNLRVMGRFNCEVAPGTAGFGFVVGVSPSFMQVAHFHGRYFLRDGYHRAYGLLRRGIHLAPVLVRDFGATEEIGVPSGMLPQGAYLGDRPPVLPDFLNDDVSADVKVPTAHKMLVIQALELTPIG